MFKTNKVVANEMLFFDTGNISDSFLEEVHRPKSVYEKRMLEGAKSNMKLYFRPRPFGRHPPAMITAKEMTVPATTDQRGHASTIHITQ